MVARWRGHARFGAFTVSIFPLLPTVLEEYLVSECVFIFWVVSQAF